MIRKSMEIHWVSRWIIDRKSVKIHQTSGMEAFRNIVGRLLEARSVWGIVVSRWPWVMAPMVPYDWVVIHIHKSQLFWCEQKGYRVLTHNHMSFFDVFGSIPYLDLIGFHVVSWIVNMCSDIVMENHWWSWIRHGIFKLDDLYFFGFEPI